MLYEVITLIAAQCEQRVVVVTAHAHRTADTEHGTAPEVFLQARNTIVARMHVRIEYRGHDGASREVDDRRACGHVDATGRTVV